MSSIKRTFVFWRPGRERRTKPWDRKRAGIGNAIDISGIGPTAIAGAGAAAVGIEKVEARMEADRRTASKRAPVDRDVKGLSGGADEMALRIRYSWRVKNRLSRRNFPLIKVRRRAVRIDL